MALLISSEKDEVYWPGIEERKEIMEGIAMSRGFPSCIGFVDGVRIPLATKPTWKYEAFLSGAEKCEYISMIVCNDKKKICFCTTGRGGSTTDKKVFHTSPLMTNRGDYFDEVQYVLGDEEYTPLTILAPPYVEDEERGPSPSDEAFNNLILDTRVTTIDHCTNMLKSRFQSLQEVRMLIKDNESRQKVGYWFRCCCVLYNILLDLEDTLDDDLEKTDSSLEQKEEVEMEPID